MPFEKVLVFGKGDIQSKLASPHTLNFITGQIGYHFIIKLDIAELFKEEWAHTKYLIPNHLWR